MYLLLLVSCDTTRHVPAGDSLYTGAKWEFDSSRVSKSLKSDLEDIPKPAPNGKLLGMPVKLWMYNLFPAERQKKRFLRGIKKSITEAPVLLSAVKIPLQEKAIQSQLYEKGYFHASVSNKVQTKDKKSVILYRVSAGAGTVVRNLFFPADSSSVSRMIREDSSNTLLKTGWQIDLTVLENERSRIDEYLKNRGYFYFSPDLILFRLDTIKPGVADLYVTIKKEAHALALQTWSIGNITIYGNYNIARDSIIQKQQGKPGKYFTLVDNKDKYRRVVYRDAILLRENQLYDKQLHSLSIERLMNLNTFRFTRFAFTGDTAAGQRRLNTRIFITPLKKNSVRLETTVNTKTGNFLGSELALRWRNVNVFKGAEWLEAKISGSFDIQMGGSQVQSANAFTLTGELKMQVPRIIPRIRVRTGINSFMPKTSIALGYSFLQRPDLYTLTAAGFSYEYIWKYKKTTEHILRPIHIVSINPFNTTPAFDSILALDAALKASFVKQLILGSKYDFHYTNTYLTKKPFTTSLRFSLSLSGNLYNTLAKPAVDTPNANRLFGIPVAQFVKAEIDLRGFLKLRQNLIWANRLRAGIAYAYGNSKIAPYSEQFFIGGSSSLRGFRIRTLGPGSFHTNEKVFRANESGDILAEASTEFRLLLSKYMGLGFFVDAGNIWYRNEPADKPGSGFEAGDFFKELAASAGTGLRFDFSILLLRLDIAFPIRKPWYPENQRWVLHEFNLGNSAWVKENLLFNIAIGYPF